jgi:hypothetical protein
MAQTPVTFDEDLGEIVFSAKVNRLVRQDLRMGRMMGNNCGMLIGDKDGTLGAPSFHQTTPQYLLIGRFRYDPTRFPYDRVLIAAHFRASSITPTWEYTLDDGVLWTPVVSSANTLPVWTFPGVVTAITGVSGEVDLDISTLTSPTWIGARIRADHSGGTAGNVHLYWGAMILYHAEFPPF